jgi:hypothetical protein
MTQGALLASDVVAKTEAAPAAATAVDRAAEAVWVAAQRRIWSSLVIVPADPSVNAVSLARAVAVAGTAQRGEPVEGLDLRGLPLSESRAHAERLADRSRPYRRVAIVDSPRQSQTALLLASAADAAVVVVERDRTAVEDVRWLVEQLGQERLVGAVMVEPRS